MNNKTKKILHSSEFYVVIIIILFCMLIQVRSGQFFTGNNLVDIIRSFTIPVMFCVGELMVLISGGVDCSFPAIASLSMFVVCKYLEDVTTNPLLFFVVAALIGLAFGVLNGVIIGKYRFPALIVTLGTSSICWGVMQGGTTVFIYAFSGMMAGIIGVFRACMLQAVHPNNLEGL